MTRELTFLFDENISSRLAASLRSCGAPGAVLHVRTIGMSGMKDNELIAKVAMNGWIAISGDRNERTRGLTSTQIAASGAIFLMLGQFFDHFDRWDRAKWIFQHWDHIHEAALNWSAGSVWLASKNGEFKQLA